MKAEDIRECSCKVNLAIRIEIENKINFWTSNQQHTICHNKMILTNHLRSLETSNWEAKEKNFQIETKVQNSNYLSRDKTPTPKEMVMREKVDKVNRNLKRKTEIHLRSKEYRWSIGKRDRDLFLDLRVRKV